MMSGMDGVFYYLHTKTRTIMNLLDHWSKVTITEVTNFVHSEPWYGCETDNLQSSGKFIFNSPSDEFYERIKFAVQSHEEGLILYVAILFKTCNKLVSGSKTHCG